MCRSHSSSAPGLSQRRETCNCVTPTGRIETQRLGRPSDACVGGSSIGTCSASTTGAGLLSGPAHLQGEPPWVTRMSRQSTGEGVPGPRGRRGHDPGCLPGCGRPIGPLVGRRHLDSRSKLAGHLEAADIRRRQRGSRRRLRVHAVLTRDRGQARISRHGGDP
jgi:hypothetical protein